LTHTLGVLLEVVGFVLKLLGGLRMGREKRAQRGDQLLDLAFVEQAFLMHLHPGLLADRIIRKEGARDVPQALAGVI